MSVLQKKYTMSRYNKRLMTLDEPRFARELAQIASALKVQLSGSAEGRLDPAIDKLFTAAVNLAFDFASALSLRACISETEKRQTKGKAKKGKKADAIR